MKCIFFGSWLFLFSFFGLISAAPLFVNPPKAVDNGNSVAVTFSVNEYTDVTVEVLDSAGRIIRHLGTGLLGPNPPSPFTANTLSQSLAWDKKDDNGAAWSGAFDIRVGLGLKAGLDRFYGWNGNYTHRYTTHGMAVDTAGNVIVADWSGSVRGFGQAAMYDRNGSYVRTLVPYPNNLPEERLKGFGRVEVRGKKGPVFYMGFHGCPLPEYFNTFRQGMTVSPQGWLVMINSMGNGAWYGRQAMKTRLLIIGLDGSCPRDTVYGPTLSKALGSGGQLAVTADGKYVYATGLREGFWTSSDVSTQVVFKALLDDTAQADTFIGEYKVAGSDSSHFNNPKGIAVDRSGNIYVSDSGNGRIVVFDSTGAFLTACSLSNPDQIQMNMKTGELYALSLPGANMARITRFTPLPDFKPAKTRLMTTGNYYYNPPVIALDWHSTPPRLWAAGQSAYFVLDDRGDSLISQPITTIKATPDRSEPSGAEWPWYIAVDPKEEVLFAGCNSWTRINLADGGMAKVTTMKGMDITAGSDGTFYTWGKTGYQDSTVMRYNKLGAAIDFDGGPREFKTGTTFFRGPDNGGRGFCQSPWGDLYFMRSARDGQAVVGIYSKSGVFMRDSLVVAPVEAGAIQVDRDSSLFMTVNVRPKANSYPEWFSRPSEFLPDPWTAKPYKLSWNYAKMNYYLYVIGSIFKFPPSGGSVLPTTEALSEEPLTATHVPAVQINGGYNQNRRITGALWQYQGVGISPASTGAIAIDHGDNVCRCHAPRITVDPNGRVVFPDPMSSSVGILDRNRNEIVRFGEYGNADQQGPAITFQFPTFVQAVNQSVYVSDPGARRVARVKLSYTEWATTGGASMVRVPPAFKTAMSLKAFPAPFNARVHIEWSQDREAQVLLAVHSVDGKLVSGLAKREFGPGAHKLAWDGRDSRGERVSSGIYLLRLSCDGQVRQQWLLLGK